MTGRPHPLRRVVTGACLAVVALGLSVASPSSAADTAPDEDTAAIDNALPGKGAVRLLVSVPGDSEIDLAGVEVTMGGKEVEAETVDASESSSLERTVVLAIDTSASMRGTRIAEAKKAALAYLETVPANVQVGVLTFDDTVDLVVPPGLDRDAARSVVSELQLTRDTSLYDGVLGALEAVGPGGANAGQRKILVLSDGKDTTDTSLDTVVEQIKASKAQVNVVSLQRGDEANAPLNAIADAGKGTMLTTADPAALTAAFAKEADNLARQVVVTAEVPAGFDETSSNVLVTVPTTDETFTASAYVPVRTAKDIAAEKARQARPQQVSAGPLDLSANVMYGAVGAIGVGLLGMILVMAMGRGKAATANVTLSQQIQAYGVMAVPGQSGPRADGASNAFSGQARQAAEKALANNKNMEARIAQSLEAAGVALKPAEWLLLRAAILVGGGLVRPAPGLEQHLLRRADHARRDRRPLALPEEEEEARLKAFGMGLADTLQLMSGSLSAGLSLSQSVDTIVREGSEPIASEFRRVVIESRLGVTIEDALEGVAQRMQSRDFGWVVMAIRIQREVGGNLAELLLTVAATLREREYLRRHVHALSAEGRLSCYVLGGLPPGFLAYLALAKPELRPADVQHADRLADVSRHGDPSRSGHLLDVQGLEGGRLMNLILPVGFGLIFVALFLVFAAVGGLTKERTGVNRSIAVLEALTAAPAEMKVELEPNFSDRVLFPLLARTQAMGRRLTPEDASERIREKLDLAGNPNGWTVERVMAGKVIGFGAGLMISLVLALLMRLGFLPTLGFVVLASLVGYLAPNMYLYQQAYDRTEKLQRASA